MRLIEDPQTLFCRWVYIYLNGAVNRHCHWWDENNPHSFCEVHIHYRRKWNVRCGVLRSSILESLFILRNVTGDVSLNILREAIYPFITQIMEDDQIILLNGFISTKKESTLLCCSSKRIFSKPVLRLADCKERHNWMACQVTWSIAFVLFSWYILRNIFFTKPESIGDFR